MAASDGPRRVFVAVSRKSPSYDDAWDSPEKTIRDAVHLLQERRLLPREAAAPTPRFLAKERWHRILIVFEVFHDAYNPDDAHLPGRNDLPVIAVSFSAKHGQQVHTESAREADPRLQDQVNTQIRNLHDWHGMGSRPPFVVDHADGKVPTYANPRSLVKVCDKASKL